MKLGLVGAESFHARAFAEICNVFQRIRGVRVTHVWGERPEHAALVAEVGRVPHIVASPREMLGQVDGALLVRRDGGRRLADARPFLEAGIPVFADKPLANRVKEARALLRLAQQAGVPVVVGSAIPLQACVPDMKRGIAGCGELFAAHLVGPGELENDYGGLPFYGSHLVELMVELFGVDVRSVQAAASGDAVTAVCHYPGDLPVTLTFRRRELFAELSRYWTVSVVGRGGPWQGEIVYDHVDGLPHDNPYVGLAKRIVRAFRTGVAPAGPARMLAPVRILEAIVASCSEGRRVRLSGSRARTGSGSPPPPRGTPRRLS